MRAIPGYEGLYSIDENGVVTSHYGRVPRVLRYKPDRDGYPRVDLWREGAPRTFCVHTLVLDTFVGPCPPGQEGRHLDGDPTNPVLSNLAWSDHSTNVRDKREHGTDHNGSKLVCSRGHSLTDPKNVRVRRRGEWIVRDCRACDVIRHQKARAS